MPTTSEIPQYLIDSYNSAEFQVHENPIFVLKIGQFSHELNVLYERANVKSAAFNTAYNPFSQELTNEQNIKRNAELEILAKTMNFAYIDGVGKDSEDVWEAEHSLLILDKDTASIIGKKFEQNAIVWCTHDATPKLLLLR